MTAADVRHGSRATYQDHGCRCDACTDASRSYWRNYRAGRRVDALIVERRGDTTWMDIAACRTVDADVFFPDPHPGPGVDRSSYSEARAVCDRCPVTAECLDYALRNHEKYGMWGGTTPKQRRTMKRGEPHTPQEQAG